MQISIRRLGPDDCANSFRVNFTVNAVTLCSDLTLWITAGNSCGDTVGASDLQLDSVSTATLAANRSGGQSVSVSSLPGFTGGEDAGLLTCGGAVTRTWRVCGRIQSANGAGTCQARACTL